MKTRLMGLACIALAGAALVACGDEEEKNMAGSSSSSSSESASSGAGGAGGSGGMTGSGGSMATTGSGGAGGSGGSGGSGGGSNLLNGCDPLTAEDHTADASVTIQFGGVAGYSYAPACLRVKVGTPVTFEGPFDMHPLIGGKVTGGLATPDVTSPITTTTAGTSAMFTMSAAGDYPYYCQFHYSGGMMGAVFVTP